MTKNDEKMNFFVKATNRSENIYTLLTDRFKYDKVAVFVGAGLSQSEGAIGWGELIKKMGNKLIDLLGLNLNDSEKEEALQNLLQELGPYEIASLLKTQLNDKFESILSQLIHFPPRSAKELELHRLILEIPFSIIITTNWDEYFERAAEEACNVSLPFQRICNDEQLSNFYGVQKPPLIKAHGQIGNKPVVTLEDLHTCETRNPLLFQFIKSIFTTHTILFIGYSMSDSNFLNYFYRYTPSNKQHFILTFKDNIEWNPDDNTKLKNFKNYLLKEQMFAMEIDLKEINTKLNEQDKKNDEIKKINPTQLYKNGYKFFLERLRTDALNKVREKSNATSKERAQKISEWLEKWQQKPEDLRIRAGLSPIALPEPKSPDDCSKFQIIYEDIKNEDISYPWSLDEYKSQKRLSKAFNNTIKAAIDNTKEVKLILSTDFKSLQQRDISAKWAACRLQALINYFEANLGNHEKIHIVDRNGPYEIQQYILGQREKIESQKRLGEYESYHEVYLIKDILLVEEDVQIFDSCFFTFQMENLQELLSTQGQGLKSLIRKIMKSKGDDFSNKEDVSCLFRKISSNEESEEQTKQKQDEFKATIEEFKEYVRSLINNSNLEDTEKENKLEYAILCQPAHILLVTLNKSILNSSIKKHLIEKWRNLFDQLTGDRSHNLRLTLYDEKNKICGSVQKASFHLSLHPSHSQKQCIIDIETEQNFKHLDRDYPCWNRHVSGFAIMGDMKNLLLRRCLTKEITLEQKTHPHLEPGIWDRTLSGHVLFGSTLSKELSDEITHHFKGVNWFNQSEGKAFEELSKTLFEQKIKDKKRKKILVRKLFHRPLQMITPKIRWFVEKQEQDEYIQEPIFSMPYLIILPSDVSSIKNLPNINKENNKQNDHSSGWLLLNKDNVEALLYDIEKLFNDAKTEKIQDYKDRISINKSRIKADSIKLPNMKKLKENPILTWESVLLLKYFGKEICDYLS